MIPEIVIVALGFYREPRRFAHLTDPVGQLPDGITELLAAPTTVFSDDRIHATATVLKADVEECRHLVAFFVKRVLLDSGGDYYRILGLPNSADRDLLLK